MTVSNNTRPLASEIMLHAALQSAVKSARSFLLSEFALKISDDWQDLTKENYVELFQEQLKRSHKRASPRLFECAVYALELIAHAKALNHEVSVRSYNAMTALLAMTVGKLSIAMVPTRKPDAQKQSARYAIIRDAYDRASLTAKISNPSAGQKTIAPIACETLFKEHGIAFSADHLIKTLRTSKALASVKKGQR